MSNDDFNSDEFLADAQETALESKYTPVPTGDFPAAMVPNSIKIKKVVFPSGSSSAAMRIPTLMIL